MNLEQNTLSKEIQEKKAQQLITLDKISVELEKGLPLTKICKDKTMPSLSTVYKWMREDDKVYAQVMKARRIGAFTLLDEINEELENPKSNQEMMYWREKLTHVRWMVSKLISDVFGEKSKQEIKQDNTITIRWGGQVKKTIDVDAQDAE
jgi:hypothetical protein